MVHRLRSNYRCACNVASPEVRTNIVNRAAVVVVHRGCMGTVNVDGLNVSITGSSVGYAGGGGRVWTNVQGGGGVSAASTGNGGNGTANTGGGGGGGNSNTGYGGNGGTGVVILRYPNTYTVTIGSGLTGSTATDGSDKVTTFTAGTGTISFS